MHEEETLATSTKFLPSRAPSKLVLVGPGLWVAVPEAEPREPETVEQRERRRLTPRAVFARPLFPRGLQAAAKKETADTADRAESAHEPR